MKTYILQKPKKLVLENLPSVPVRTKDDVKVKIELAAVTNTDLSIFDGKYKTALPLALGRQAVGVVSEALPDNDERFQKGDRVVIESFVPCGKCYFCKTGEEQKCVNMRVLGYTAPGIFSDFVTVPHNLLHRIPDQMHYGTAIFTEYVSMALNVIDALRLSPGDHVAITSANKLGYILAQLVTYYQGIAIVLDENQEQLSKMAEENINYTLNVKKAGWKDNVSGITGGRMCEKVVYIVESQESFNDAIDICAKNGTICLCGFMRTSEKCDLGKIHDRQLNIVSVKNSNGNFPAAINMLATKKVNTARLQGETFRFAELPEKMLAMTEAEAKYSCTQFRID